MKEDDAPARAIIQELWIYRPNATIDVSLA
jgi:hypothetical protein